MSEPASVPARVAARSLVERIGELGCAPGDPDELRLRKQTLVLATSVVALLACAWVGTYAALDRPAAAAVPLFYQVVAVASLAAFSRTKAFRPFRLTILSTMLILPFVLQWLLGGFVNSSAVCLWSATSALSALFFYGSRGALPWFIGFLALMLVSGIVDPALAAQAEPIPATVRLLFFVLNVTAVSLTLFLLLQYEVVQRELAQARSDNLLHDILPGPIASRLKRDPSAIAEAYPDATVLFADVVDFTPFAERADAAEVVRLLDEVFGRLDILAERHGLEKIKTIGDAYMVVGGVPVVRPDHVTAMADFALDVLAEFDTIAAGGRSLDVRIGIDRGPVVAGVIGRRKFSYDLWGDTVNMASRMESHGLPGRIQVTERVADALRDRYDLEPRGPIDIKGKGMLETWFLVRRAERAHEVVAQPAALAG